MDLLILICLILQSFENFEFLVHLFLKNIWAIQSFCETLKTFYYSSWTLESFFILVLFLMFCYYRGHSLYPRCPNIILYFIWVLATARHIPWSIYLKKLVSMKISFLIFMSFVKIASVLALAMLSMSIKSVIDYLDSNKVTKRWWSCK